MNVTPSTTLLSHSKIPEHFTSMQILNYCFAVKMVYKELLKAVFGKGNVLTAVHQ